MKFNVFKNSFTHVVRTSISYERSRYTKGAVICLWYDAFSEHTAITYQQQPLAHTLDVRVKVRVFNPNDTSTLSWKAFFYGTYYTHTEYIRNISDKSEIHTYRGIYIYISIHSYTDKQQSIVYLQYIAAIHTYLPTIYTDTQALN